MSKKGHSKNPALKRWYCLAIFWPVLCLVFAGIIIGGSGRTADERISDAMFTILPLIFFSIGMSIRRRLLKERWNATAFTAAVVVSEGMRKRAGRNKRYYPEFEFQVNGINYRVTAPFGSGSQLAKRGERTELYYTPEAPSACPAKI